MADYLMDGVKILNTNPPAHPGYLAVYIIVAIMLHPGQHQGLHGSHPSLRAALRVPS